MSLACGLDYYTGIIYKAMVEASAPSGFKANPSVDSSEPVAPKKKPAKKSGKEGEDEEEINENSVGVGSIAAGGRYDNLVGSLKASASGDAKKNQLIPCVGISFGLDRIFAILYPKWQERGRRQKELLAFVIAAGDGLLVERLKLISEVREAGIKVRFVSH